MNRTLDVGGIRIALQTHAHGFVDWLEATDAYRNFLSAADGPTDAVATLRFRGRRNRGFWENRSTTTVLRHRGSECHILHHDFLAHCSPDFTELEVILPAEDIYAFDNLLRFLLSIHAVRHGGFLLHAATLEHREEAYVLYGLSGAGKSTAAAQSVPGGRRCLAEDATLVMAGDSKATAWATPLLHHPGPEPPRPGGFPVRGFFRLAQTPAFELTRLTGARAARSLMRRVLLYEGFHLTADIFSICLDLAASSDHYELGLALGDDFWPPLLEALVE